jgi:uncharacterized RDD family membrane protein YckC
MTTSPGWYKDPAEPTTQRYWDGEGWVGEPIPIDATPPATPAVKKRPAAPPRGPAQPSVAGIPTEPTRPHGFALAGLGARAVARVIDVSVLLLLNVVVNGWFVYQWFLESAPYSQAVFQALMEKRPLQDIPRPARMDNLVIVISLLAMALWFAYEVPATAHSGQTLGKRAARIKVVRVESQEPLGFLRAIRRWNPMGLSLVLIYCCGPLFVVLPIFDVIFIPIDRVNRMALHDRSAGTYVVQLPESPGQKG